MESAEAKADWPAAIHGMLSGLNVRQVAYVPDAGHSQLLRLCAADDQMRMVKLTREEEGIGVLAGAWLGGERGALLMQSSGVGNCINAIASITTVCRFPLLMLVTMRGEWGEGNPWQVPMGSAVAGVLSAVGVRTARCEKPDEVAETVEAMAGLSFKSNCATAVLLTQRLIGAKSFQD